MEDLFDDEDAIISKLKIFAAYMSDRFFLNMGQDDIEMAVFEIMMLHDFKKQQPQPRKRQRTMINESHMRLAMYHDCTSTGCNDSNCSMCETNTSRRCTRNVKSKYIIGDAMTANCGAPLNVKLVDSSLESIINSELNVQMIVLNGGMYDDICSKSISILSHDEIASCSVPIGSYSVRLVGGRADISFVKFDDSSEATLGGKSPNFRMLFRAVDDDMRPRDDIVYAVSEAFAVTTKRTRGALKSVIPTISDDITRVVHVGKSTVLKLFDIKAAARKVGLGIMVDDDMNSITNVGHFKNLVHQCEIDHGLMRDIMHILKFSPTKWKETSAHAMSAAEPDFRLRMWLDPNAKWGLLYGCNNGVINVEPTAVVKLESDAIKTIPLVDLDPLEMSRVKVLQSEAAADWFRDGHPGWQIYHNFTLLP